MYSLKQIAEITGSAFIGKHDYNVSLFLTDSRSVLLPEGVLFIALKTGKNNGHNYIQSLIEKGVCAFLVQEGEADAAALAGQNISFIVSKNPLHALQLLAAHHRRQFNIPVIGITGSNGKTVVKEWLYQLLKKDFTICRSPKSYNSQLGVPLSVLNLNHTHTLAIFEAGISQPGEMEILADIIRPTFGIITSLGAPHDEGFENRDQKLNEKLKLVANCSAILATGISADKIPHAIAGKTTLVSYDSDSDYCLSFSGKELTLNTKKDKYIYEIPFTDEASILNSATCITALKHFEIPEEEIALRIKELQPIALRLEIKNGINNSLLINDFYNSDLDSLKIALNFLQQQNRRLFKSIIISDVEQSGISDATLYKEISTLIRTNKIDFLVGIGKRISQFKSFFKADSLFFENTTDFIKLFKSFDFRFSNSTVLLKGARSFGFENLGNLLQQKSHDTVFVIDLNKLTHNINYYRSLISPEVKLMCMVKAMGYGGGGSELGRTLQHLGVNYLAVAYADEGVELRQSQITTPIMVMSPEFDALDDIINYQLEPEIYSFKILEAFIQRLDKLGISEPYPVHLKIDTGMHRLGFEPQMIDDLIKKLRLSKQIKVQSIFSHLSASDNPLLDDFTNQQIDVFTDVCAKIEASIGHSVIKHICNSGGISRFKKAHFNMVRLGIGMHGIGVDANEQKHLQNVSSLKTKISQIKQVKAGETVGYNRNGKVDSSITIATIPIGYADGFSRALGNKKFSVYINGRACKTIGNICMDMCMVDVTGVNCSEGDEVIVFENNAQLNDMATAMGTITYEVLTSVSGRVKRIYIQE